MDQIIFDSGLRNRRGKIKISSDLLKDIMNDDVQICTKLFSNFFPVAVERDYNSYITGRDPDFIYYGVSPHFQLLNESEETLEYEVIFKITSTDFDGRTVNISFIKKDK